MELSLVEENGIQLVEGQPDQPFLSRVQDVGSVVEMCLSSGADAALLYASNLTAAFFDLSSGEAGEILQKLQTYRIRLAVVCAPGSVQFSRRFGDLLVEAHQGQDFKVCETRRDALAWLGASR